MTSVAATSSSGGSTPRDRYGPRDTVMRTEASPSGPSRPSAASRSAMPAARRASTSSGRAMSSPSAERCSRARCSAELGRTAGAGAQRLEHAVAELEAAIEHRQVRARRRAGPRRRPRRGRQRRRSRSRATSTPPMAPSGPRALATVSSHSAAGSLPQVMPPPTCRVRRRPSATNVRMRMLVCIAPSGPIQPSAPVYGPRRTGSRPSSSSIARIFGAPVIEPPGNDAASRSNASRPAASRPVTVDTRCWTAAVRSSRHSRGTRTRAGHAHPTEVVAQDVDDHHVLGAVLGAGQQLAGQGAVLGPVAAARAGCP